MADSNKNDMLEKLKKDIAKGTPERLYIFFGEEQYLKNRYIEKLKDTVVGETIEEFNFIKFNGKELDLQTLGECIDCYPVMSEKKLIVVEDFDIYKQNKENAGILVGLLNDIPEYICLVFSYTTLNYSEKISKENEIEELKELKSTVKKNAVIIEFEHASQKELSNWVTRRFASCGKKIDGKICDYLIFYCGEDMNTLVSEINKIAACTESESITKQDIERVAIKSLDAKIYELTDSMAEGRFDSAVRTLRDLLNMGYETVVLSSAIGRQYVKLLDAKLIIEDGKDISYIQKFWSAKQYPAEKLAKSAGKYKKSALEEAVKICGRCDVASKSEFGDRKEMLEMMLLSIAAVMMEQNRG